MSRPTRALIDTQALSHNLETIRGLSNSARILAVVKANAYGHGIVQVSRALNGADAFGVARVDEARALRDAGFKRPVLMLEGFQDEGELAAVRELKLEAVLHHPDQLTLLDTIPGPPVRCWLKLDSGMHRLGFPLEDGREVFERLKGMAAVEQPVVLMSHLACADEPDNPMTREQLDAFDAVVSDLPGERSVANSAGLLAWSGSRHGWVRPGIALYGIAPFTDRVGADYDLKPAMTLESTLIAVNHVKQGEPVGYGATWRAPEDMVIGVAAIGYGDGYPWHAQSGTPVLVNGVRCELAGRVSMDMITMDLRNAPDASVGDPVVLWGRGLPVEEVARYCDTIAYTLVCGVTPRVAFVYQ